MASLVIQLGTYVAWSGGALFFVWLELDRRRPGDGEWGKAEWSLAALLGGGLCLPMLFSRDHGHGLSRGLQLAFAVLVFALTVRLWLSAAFGVAAL
ncbi:MAG: hypothetical protein IT374_21340 [Polyangiaceae bacterium]|nr:hypothetical protein [Polyangiaceae bacterium]